MGRTPSRAGFGRLDRVRLIERLDPVEHHLLIYRTSAGLELPWDYTRALELALFRTFCVPSISRLVDRTREFAERPQRRYDDTRVLMGELALHGYDSVRGKTALRTMNRLHGRYDISNDDMLYVLSTFIYEPVRWIDRYGWRPLTEHERVAGYVFYREVGKRMGIKDIPPSFEAFERFNVDYERDHFRYSPSNEAVGRSTLTMFCGWFPQPLRGVAEQGVLAVLGKPLRAAFGFAEPSPGAERAVERVLRAHGAAERWLPKRMVNRLERGTVNRTYPGYPKGYRLEDVGAHGS
ncbi:oxygenase MpaB family protein [Allokutzneria multivorans]|uniref:oxygenase MpaB family protein n=1 Tax=Allokutzneria multivorans TaxID=1142134 RepID=UPI0031ED5BF4